MTASMKFQGCEYVLKFKRKISASKKKAIISAITDSPLFHRSYKKDGNTWYELRSKRNQHLQNHPDATVLIATDFMYVMKKSRKESVWKNLEKLQEDIENDLDFRAAGEFFSYS